MRILIVPSWYPTEESPISGIFFKELAEAMAREGHEVAVSVINISRKNKGNSSSHRLVNGVHEFRFDKRNITPGLKAGMNLQKKNIAKKVYKEIKEEFGVPDIIHLESCEMLEVAGALSDMFGCKLAYTEHLSNVLRAEATDSLYERFKACLIKASVNIAISEVFAEKMRNAGMNPVVIPNGIETSSFGLSEPGNTFTVKAIGSLRKIKRYDVLIEAFAKFVKLGATAASDARLVIGGKGEDEAALKELAKNLEIEERVTFVGEVAKKDVPDFYLDANVFVCSSDTETFSVVTAEALCSGVPVVATRCGGPDGMINDDNGILVEVGSADEMADALMTISMRDYDREDISAAAKAKFDYAGVVAEHIAAYGKY